MNNFIPLMEQVISDVGFTGIQNLGSGIATVKKAAAVCAELGMTTGETLCNDFILAVNGGEYDRAAIIFSRLCCYCECISG